MSGGRVGRSASRVPAMDVDVRSMSDSPLAHAAGSAAVAAAGGAAALASSPSPPATSATFATPSATQASDARGGARPGGVLSAAAAAGPSSASSPAPSSATTRHRDATRGRQSGGSGPAPAASSLASSSAALLLALLVVSASASPAQMLNLELGAQLERVAALDELSGLGQFRQRRAHNLLVVGAQGGSHLLLNALADGDGARPPALLQARDRIVDQIRVRRVLQPLPSSLGGPRRIPAHQVSRRRHA